MSGPADLTVSTLLIAAAVLDVHGHTPGARKALDAIQRAIDTHPDRETLEES